jgi:hypothetical protein
MLDFQNVCGYAIEDDLEVSLKEFPLDDDTEEEPYSIAYTPCSANTVTTTASSGISSRSRSSFEDREAGSLYEPGRCHSGCTSPPPPPSSSSRIRRRTTTIPKPTHTHTHTHTGTSETPNLMEDSIFEILSPQNSHDEADDDAQVLSPEIMEGMQSHFPLIKKGESFWLQYSLVRDGANREALLWNTRNSEHSVLAIETVDGEIFGAFTSQKWHPHHDFFGSRESFLWRWNPDQEEPLEFFHFSHLNEDVQLCTHDRLAVGGGIRKLDPGYGFGISLDKDLLTGTTNKCMTFLSPPLSKLHADGSTFEVRNLEVWALTPCLSLEDAEKVQNKQWS